MKKLHLLMTLLSALTILSFAVAIEPLAIGAALPKDELKLKEVSGKEITLRSSIKDNGLLVMFSCNTCPVVVANQSRTNEICAYAAEKKLGVVVLNSNEGNRQSSESLAAMKKYAEEQQYKWSYAEDKNNELADAFGASRTPECFVFNKQGKLVYHGAIDDSPQDESSVNRKHLQHAINELVAGKTVTVAKTKSIGCGIKRAR